jgi:hypothetical protein
MRILVLLVRYGTEKYPDAADAVEAFYQALPDIEHKTIVIDNALPASAPVEIQGGMVVLPGNNDAWEFSAWDTGVRWIGPDIWSYDLVHLITSAFQTLYTGYIPRFTDPVLQWASRHPVCLGHIDCFNEPVEILSYHSQHWTRSCFLFLPPAEVKALGSLVTIHRKGDFFSGDPTSPFRASARLSPGYRDNIIGWLTGRDIGQGVTWHSAFGLTKESLPYFEQKAQSILNEHLLSVRLRALGCAAIDVTWLHGSLAEGRVAFPTPGWRHQVQGRTADAVLLQGRSADQNLGQPDEAPLALK